MFTSYETTEDKDQPKRKLYKHMCKKNINMKYDFKKNVLFPNIRTQGCYFKSNLSSDDETMNGNEKLAYKYLNSLVMKKCKDIYEVGTIHGKYILNRLLDKTNESKCFEGQSVTPTINLNQTKYAIILHNKCGKNCLFLESLKLWEELNHPNIIKLIDVIEKPDKFLLITRLASKGNLLTYFNQKVMNTSTNQMDIKTKRKGLSIKEIKSIFLQICKGVDYLHNKKKIVHNDLKLENILIDDSDGNFSAFISDFCYSFAIPTKIHSNKSQSYREESNSNEYNHLREKKNLITISKTCVCRKCTVLRSHLIQGTPQYLAPEKIRFCRFMKSKHSDTTIAIPNPLYSDIWSLGVMLYILVLGRYPFDDNHVSASLYNTILKGKYIDPFESGDTFNKDKLTTDNKNLISLITSMLSVDPFSRPTITQILYSPWLNCKTPIGP